MQTIKIPYSDTIFSFHGCPVDCGHMYHIDILYRLRKTKILKLGYATVYPGLISKLVRNFMIIFILQLGTAKLITLE